MLLRDDASLSEIMLRNVKMNGKILLINTSRDLDNELESHSKGSRGECATNSSLGESLYSSLGEA